MRRTSHGQPGEQWPPLDHGGAGKPIRCGGPDGNLYSGCVGAQSAELSMAEKWCGNQRRELGELHNARDDQFRQRVAFYGVGQQLSRERNKQRAHVDGQRGRARSLDYYAAGE